MQTIKQGRDAIDRLKERRRELWRKSDKIQATEGVGVGVEACRARVERINRAISRLFDRTHSGILGPYVPPPQ